MIKYFTFFKLRFISGLQYRTAALAGILTQFFFGMVFIMVYMAFYESGALNAPMSIEQLITYVWINQAIYSLTYIYHREKDIIEMIKNGNVCYELCRPNNLYFMWFFKIYGTKLSNVALRCIPIILIGLILPSPYNIMISSFPNFLGFIATLILGSLLITAIASLLHVLTFYTIEADGILNTFKVIAEFFAGGIVPIPFLPKIIQNISKVLPFQYISDVPVRIYVGNISLTEVKSILLIQLIWFILVVILSLLLTKKALKKVVVQGG